GPTGTDHEAVSGVGTLTKQRANELVERVVAPDIFPHQLDGPIDVRPSSRVDCTRRSIERLTRRQRLEGGLYRGRADRLGSFHWMQLLEYRGDTVRAADAAPRSARKPAGSRGYDLRTGRCDGRLDLDPLAVADPFDVLQVGGRA